ncbi:MAG: hypothetical protein IPG79_19780 [Saprospiraceae bacterium]|nr:hypothetical protein [Saprospiraceae bacterium]
MVKNPQADNSLVAYYQFNANGQNDYDKVGSKHISLLNSALKEPSGIPVGKGLSKRLSVTSGGIKDFNPADMVMYFPSSGTYPNGELVVTKSIRYPMLPHPVLPLPITIGLSTIMGAIRIFLCWIHFILKMLQILQEVVRHLFSDITGVNNMMKATPGEM